MTHLLHVEKCSPHDLEAAALLQELKNAFALPSLDDLRLIQRYHVHGLSDSEFEEASRRIFSEPQTDRFFSTLKLGENETAFAYEYLPGQFDQRADSAVQCLQLLTGKEKIYVRASKVIVLKSSTALSEKELSDIKGFVFNPVDAHELPLDFTPSLPQAEIPADVAVLTGFRERSAEEIRAQYGLAMSVDDVAFTQNYFREEEQRDPSITELRMLDTYWSDHCRHTTFHTELTEVKFDNPNGPAARAWSDYLVNREKLGRGDKTISLMDIALLSMRELRASGELDNLEVSDEVNAASIVIPVSIAGKTEEWLLMFKNETHNHPTEIEPFGGASTCLGGCIRDPLSGRSYVYQAMRITGAANPLTPISETIPGKLPQRRLCQIAAQGYSSYGNQIGVAGGQVAEIYHPGYTAKRMELGALVAAAPRANVFRGTPAAGDAILLIGARTGRDGIGGATGSSREQEGEAEDNSAEVQKGNPSVERNILRLFRKPEVSKKIKVCNDFGAGGVSVAIGEIAPSLDINLDKVPAKYPGLDGTELAISESQERMAVCIDPADIDFFLAAADEENLECTKVAEVTDSGRLLMYWRGKTIVNLSRAFLDTNGVTQSAAATIAPAKLPDSFKQAASSDLATHLASLNVCSQRGLGEMFDNSVGAGTVLWPYGGENQLTPGDAMVAKIPVLQGETDHCSYMAWGYDPYLSEQSPFHGAVYAITESVCKAVAAGARLSDIRLTLQEYFPALGEDPKRWGLPLAALLGAYHAQKQLRLAAIGGKDSMSGSFNEIDVPPTLVSFAVAPGLASRALSPEFKKTGSKLSLISVPTDAEQLPGFARLRELAEEIYSLNAAGKLLSLHHIGAAGLGAALAKSAFGNGIGAVISTDHNLYEKAYFTFLVEHQEELPVSLQAEEIGNTADAATLSFNGEVYELDKLRAAWEGTLEPLYPTKTKQVNQLRHAASTTAPRKTFPSLNLASAPKVLIPCFPGTNGEYDAARAFERAGAKTETFVFRNRTNSQIIESLDALAEKISHSQILVFPGGAVVGDEPDGAAKFSVAVLRKPQVAEAVMSLLKDRKGLILGICNGFQALIKSGLLPYGEFRDVAVESPTLVRNAINRHQSRFVHTRIISTNSPWLQKHELGGVYHSPLSVAGGRFWANETALNELFANGQVAAQYCSPDGTPSMDIAHNPTGSLAAIESIISPCGQILGKIAHSERGGEQIAKNLPFAKHEPLFEAGLAYFK